MKTSLTAPVLSIIAMLPLISTNGSAQQLTKEQTKVVEPVQGILNAAERDDVRGFDALVAPGFYMYDEGKRWDGDSIMTLIRNLHELGTMMKWQVTQPDVHIQGRTAWVAYLNQGTFTSASGATDRKWLESAFLMRVHGRWLVAFVHSTPIANPK